MLRCVAARAFVGNADAERIGRKLKRVVCHDRRRGDDRLPYCCEQTPSQLASAYRN